MKLFFEKHVRPAMSFFVGLVVFDLLTMEQSIRSIILRMDTIKFRSDLFFEELISIAFPYFTLITVLLVLLVWISSALKVTKFKLFYGLIFAYILLLATVRFPQIIYGIRFSQYFPSNVGFLGRPLLIAASSFLLLLCLWQIRKCWVLTQHRFSKANAVAALFFVAGVLSYNVIFLGTNGDFDTASVENADKPKENIIVISVDSLNADSDDVIRRFANTALTEFLDKSKKQENVIADVTQTHGSFASIFSGRPPFQGPVRYPYNEEMANPKQSLFETLKGLKDSGYGIKFVRDEMATSPIFSGDVIDKVFSPQNKQRSNSLGLIFSSIVVYGAFDNFVGRLIFPEAYDNSNFSYGQNANGILVNFRKALEENKLDQRKELIFFHTCFLHTPLQLPYPYYPDQVYSESEYKRLSYPETYLKIFEVKEHARILAGAAYNQELHLRGVKMLVEKMLNPLFDMLKRDGSLSSSTIVLMSDHGENLWGDYKYLVGVNPLPFHGDTFLFGSKNEFSYFRYRSPSAIEAAPAGPINLSQMFRKVIKQDPRSDLVYSENAFVPQKSNLSMPIFLNYSMIANSFKRSPYYDYYFASAELIFPAILQKQRAVFFGGFKLVAYITEYGRRFFLCNFETDKKCETNLFNNVQYLSIQRKMLMDIGRAIDVDRDAGLDVAINLSEEPEGLTEYLKSKNLWLKTYGAFVLYKNFYDFKNALDVLKEVFLTTKSEDLKLQIARWALSNCLYVDEDTRPFLQTLAQYNIDYSPTIRTTLINARYFFCDTEATASVQRTSDVWMADWQVDMIENLDALYNLPEGIQYLRDLEKKYNIRAQKRISDIFLNIPKEFQREESVRFTDYVKLRYKYYFSYDLPDDRDLYFYLKSLLSIKLGIENGAEIISELAHTRGSAAFESRLFNYLERRYSLEPIKYQTNRQNIRKIRLDRLKNYFSGR